MPAETDCKDRDSCQLQDNARYIDSHSGTTCVVTFDLFLQTVFLFLSPRFPLPHSCGATTTPLEKTRTLLEKTGRRLGKSLVRMLFLGHRPNPDRLTSGTDHKKGSERLGNARCHLIGRLGISARGTRLRIRRRGCARRAEWPLVRTGQMRKGGG